MSAALRAGKGERDLEFREERVWGAKSTIAVPLDDDARGSGRTHAPAKGATVAPSLFSSATVF